MVITEAYISVTIQSITTVIPYCGIFSQESPGSLRVAMAAQGSPGTVIVAMISQGSPGTVRVAKTS